MLPLLFSPLYKIYTNIPYIKYFELHFCILIGQPTYEVIIFFLQFESAIRIYIL
jgi:hypothetical protein